MADAVVLCTSCHGDGVAKSTKSLTKVLKKSQKSVDKLKGLW